jgi:hypothetical protein
LYLVSVVFTVAVDDVFAVKRVVFFEWLVRPKAVSIDSE